MQISSGLRAAAVAVVAMAGVGLSSVATPAYADTGTINFKVFKAGFVFGGQGGSGTLRFKGRNYPISIGGLSYGLMIGASETSFRGTVRNIRRPSDVAGVYGAAGGGATLGRGAQAIVLTNQKGAVLALSGRQVGLQANLDLSGLAISMR